MIVLSQLPEIICRPSGVTATELTVLECPKSVRRARPLANSHTLMVLSALPEITCWPSGVTATELTQCGYPENVRSNAAGERLDQAASSEAAPFQLPEAAASRDSIE